MTSADDTDLLAAEYVLGTLTGDERQLVAARRMRDAVLNAAIEAWERRFAPLLETFPAITPPADIFARIMAVIDGAAQPNLGATGNIVEFARLGRKLRNWRIAAATATAIAASLAAVIGVQRFQPNVAGQNFVAVLQKDAASPAFLVSVDLKSRLLTIRPVAAQAQPGKSYELWMVHESLAAPKSLGTVDGRDFMQRPEIAKFDASVIENATYAISLEPAGGSPTGSPTEVVFAGKLIASKP